MKIISNNYAGNTNIWWIGKVEDADDPLKIGRYRVRIHGAHDKKTSVVPKEFLPWAQCVLPTTEGGVSGIGRSSGIIPGAQVFGMFLDGENKQIPLILGSIHTINQPSKMQKEEASPRSSEQRPEPSSPDAVQNNDLPDTPNAEIDKNLAGSSNAEKIFNYFIGQGWTAAQAAGLVGNFYAESNLNPKAYNPNDKGKASQGLAQWRGDRQQALKNFARENNSDEDSLSLQLAFVQHELNTSEASAGTKLKGAQTPAEAAYIVSRYYERPEYSIINGQYTSPSLNKRINFAEEVYERFK